MNEKTMTGYSSIDKPWNKYYNCSSDTVDIPQMTFYECLWNKNHDHLNETALIYYGRKIKYVEMFENIEQIKGIFAHYGINKNDRVVMFTSSTPETVFAVLALWRLGAVAAMINPVFEEQQIIDRVNETGATLLICLDQLYSKIESIIPKTCIQKTVIMPIYQSMPKVMGVLARIKLEKNIKYSDSVISWKDFLESASDTREDVKWEKEMPLVMVYSSGTTGASKAIILTNESLCSMFKHYEESDFQLCPYSRGDSIIQIVPVWFSTGLVASLLMPLCAGATVVLEPVFNGENFAKDIEKYRPHIALASTSLWLYAIHCKRLSKVDLSGMRYPISGGEPTTPEIEKEINDFLQMHGAPSVLLKGYGMCELGSTAALESPQHNKVGSCGYPLTGVIISAFDIDTDREVTYGQLGEIRVSTPCRMKEYYMNPKATDEFFYKDSKGIVWGKTGDIGYIDKDGFVFVLGRSSDSYVAPSGKRVFNFDIENVIMKDKDIRECEVVAVDMGNGFVPIAHLIMKDPTNISKEELAHHIIALCKNELPAEMIPYGVNFVDTFPMNKNGKRDMEAIRRDVDHIIRG